MLKKTAIVVTVFFLINSCYYDKEDLLYPGLNNCNTTPVSFSAQIAPLISTRCTFPECHGAGSVNGPGQLTSYNLIKNAAVQIKSAVVSRYMPAEITTIGTGVNPSLNPLTDQQIKMISCWVDAGAPNN